MVDPAALPFSNFGGAPEPDAGLDAEIIRPARFAELKKSQGAMPTGTVLDRLCLTEDGSRSLGGIPRGCTIAFAGPPGKGKTRSALAILCRVAAAGEKVGLVVAEEGFHDESGGGRDDLLSRLVKIGMAATKLDEATFRTEVLERIFVLEQ